MPFYIVVLLLARFKYQFELLIDYSFRGLVLNSFLR